MKKILFSDQSIRIQIFSNLDSMFLLNTKPPCRSHSYQTRPDQDQEDGGHHNDETFDRVLNNFGVDGVKNRVELLHRG